MDLTPETRIMELVEEYPWMIDFLPTIVPQFKRIRNPSQREKMEDKATIEIASIAAGLTADQFIEILQTEIVNRGAVGERLVVKEKIVSVEKLERARR